MALLHPDGYGECYDVPTIKLRSKDRPAWTEWRREWHIGLAMTLPAMIVIEDVGAMPKQGLSSTFNFGRSFGFVHAIASGIGCPVHFVTPSVWKGKLGLLNSDKGASREMVRTLFPQCAALVERVKDDGRAEAILLAYYGRKFLT